MSRRDRYDFFLSRRGAVAEIAQEVADTLHGEGYSVLIQDYDIPFTANFVEAMHEAVKNSRDLIVLYTPDYEDSPHTRKEFTSFEADRHLTGEERRIIILRCADTPVRGLFADKVFQDLAGVADAAERRQRILAAIRGESQAQKPPPRPFYIPHAHNLTFTGRQRELDRLDQVLLSGGVAAITQAGRAALHGLGGVGKTSLATEYAYRYGEFYAGLWWCNAASRASLLSSLAFLAKSKGLVQEAEPDDEKAVRLVFNHLATLRTPWLLVYDNADDPQELTELFPAAGARVLITSRFPDWRNLAAEVQVDVLRPDEAAAFLQARAGRNDEGGARELAEALGCLPLALDHAAAYTAELNEGFAAYAARVRKLMNIPRSAVSEYPRSVAATFDVAIHNAIRKASYAGEFLVFLSNCAPDPIPRLLADRMCGGLPEEWEKALRALVQASLIRHEILAGNVPALVIHRLVMAVARDRQLSLLGPTRGSWRKIMRAIIPGSMVRLGLSVLVQTNLTSSLVALFPSDCFDNPASSPLAEVLLPHVRVWGDRIIDEQATADHALVLNRAGSYLHGRGRLAAAKSLFEQALTIRETVLGKEHLDTATSLNNLGLLLHDQGDTVAAKRVYERALEIRRKVLPPEHPDTATSLSNLGLLLQDGRDLLAAKRHLERALEIREKVLPPEHPDTATSLNNLGSLLNDQHDFAAAKPLLERALEIREKILPHEHPSIAYSLNNLGYMLSRQGDLAGARKFYERALCTREKVLGPQHPKTALSLNNLASILREQGELDAAKPLNERALTIRENVLGPDHPDTAISLNNLATVLEDMDDFGKAKQNYERAIAIDQAKLGSEHPSTMLHENNLANLLARMSKQAEPGVNPSAHYHRSSNGLARPYREEEIDPSSPDTWTAMPRNAACPCGSGKKYKYCHGQI